jgi:hypothetical protein
MESALNTLCFVIEVGGITFCEKKNLSFSEVLIRESKLYGFSFFFLAAL